MESLPTASRLGLLKPSVRTKAGYRLYGESDLARLEQIIVLKFLGLPLKEIRNLFDRKYYTFGTFFERDQVRFLQLSDPRTLSPAAPLAVLAGIRAVF